jgi:hypothetical protein
MNRSLLIIIFFLTSCNSKPIMDDFNFTNRMSYDEFKIKLEEYAKNSTFPNIDD